jgi:hypothetical protein
MYAQFMTTYFGHSVLVDLKEDTANQWYKLHLPPRYGTIWTPEDMDAITEKYYLITNGVQGNRPYYPKFGKGDLIWR